MQTNIPLEEALDLLLRRCSVLPAETVPLSESFGRVLAEDFYAGEDVPPFDRSPYDGYAMRAADIAGAAPGAPARLKVLEEVPAGYTPRYPLEAGLATKVMTGAPIPAGADCVEKYEVTERAGDVVSVFAPLRAGQNIVPAGEDIRRGQLLAPAGFAVNGALMGLLAATGAPEVLVRRRPRVAIACTGDELLEISAPLEPGKIRGSNRYALTGYLQALGAEPVPCGTARDRADEVAALIRGALDRSDLVLTTGGVSAGDYDVVKEAAAVAGAELIFHRLALKPGAPSLAAAHGDKIILGLSGNPAAALLVFLLIGVPLVKKLAGRADIAYRVAEAVLLSEFPKSSRERRFLRGRVALADGVVSFDPVGGQNNDSMTSLLRCDALAEIPAGSPPLAAGTRLKIRLLDNFSTEGAP
jgi:molybdopterin molybdotransferase